MAITREIWLNSLVETLFADNSFAQRLTNHSAFTDGKKVHVPNAGTPPTVVKNRSTFPATVGTRTDADLSYDLDAFTTDPIRIPKVDEYELSYDKRSSVTEQARRALVDAVYLNVLTTLATTCASGNKSVQATFGKAAMKAIRTNFDEANVPATGRCVVLTPKAYMELLGDLTDAEAMAFTGSADAAQGKVGTIYGFEVFERSKIDSTASSKVNSIAWQKDSASCALGATDLFVDEGSATMYGDVISAQVRAGGAIIRADKAGVYVTTTA